MRENLGTSMFFFFYAISLKRIVEETYLSPHRKNYIIKMEARKEGGGKTFVKS